MQLTDRVIIITGATGNLGIPVTERVLTEGANVVIAYRDEAGLQALLDRIRPAGETPAPRDRFLPLKADLGVADEVAALVQQTVEAYGKLDALVHLAGGWAGGKPVAEMAEADWDKMLNMNLKSAFLCARYALPPMLARHHGREGKHGRLVFVSSKGALDAPAGSAAYNVSKAGLNTLVETLRKELRGTGVTANAVMPSTIDTPPNRAAMPKADFSNWVTPEDLAQVIVYLLSDASGPVSGAVVPVFGGVA